MNGQEPHSPDSRRTVPGYIFRLTTFVVALATLLSGWCSLFPPAKYWFLAITGLAFPLLFALNALFTSLLLVGGKKSALVPLVVFLLTIAQLPLYVQVRFSSAPKANAQGHDGLRVMSYNVRLFDLYNWSHNKQTRDRILEFIDGVGPDILCMQEFFTTENKPLQNIEELTRLLHPQGIHTEFPITLFGKDHYGIATLSRYPIVRKGVLYFDRKTANVCIFSDIVYKNDTLRIYNCHLQSVRFGEKDYKFIKDLQNMDDESNDDSYLRTRNIFMRLKNAYIKRENQAELIADHIRHSPYPVIVCGDFNDTPISYVYNKISDNLLDAFRESGSGWGTTYAGPIPGLRIDYILHSPALTSTGYQRYPEKLSDHFAIAATVTTGSSQN